MDVGAGGGLGGAGRRNLGTGGGGDEGEGPGIRKRGWLGAEAVGRGGVRIRVVVRGAGEGGGEENV